MTHTQSVITPSVKVVEPNFIPGLDVNTSNTPKRLVQVTYLVHSLSDLISMVVYNIDLNFFKYRILTLLPYAFVNAFDCSIYTLWNSIYKYHSMHINTLPYY